MIPIVFLPGIMGSNLRVKPARIAEVRRRFEEEGRGREFRAQAWAPPSVRHSLLRTAGSVLLEQLGGNCRAVRTARAWKQLGPKLRQVLLNPETVEVDPNGFLPGFIPHLPIMDGKPGPAAARARGWGQVHWESYQPILQYLERNLNPRWAEERASTSAWEQKLGLIGAILKSFLGPDAEPVVPGAEELGRVVRSRYPVHAVGYNWTQSNLHSAEDVLAGIRNILQGYRGQGETCRQVILVTHSMGGLVARVVSQLAAEAGEPDLVLGVVHGVMPAIGAPVAYRRMVAGTEAERLVWLKELRGAFPTIAGRTAAETTPVMANAPGALELLPSHLYPPGWLKVERPAGAEGVQTVFTLPERDPYQEIYRQRNTWWRMVDPGLLDPAQIGGWTAEGYHPELAWENFLKRMSEVEALHRTRLARHHYHSPSFYFYGEQEPTFGSVRWLLGPSAVDLREGEIRVSRPGPGDGKGSCELRAFPRGAPSGGRVGGEYDPGQEFRFHAELAPADDLGDGTVPTISGHAPASVIPYGVATDVQRFDHADAFKNLLSQMFTAMAICKLAGAGAPGGQP